VRIPSGEGCTAPEKGGKGASRGGSHGGTALSSLREKVHPHCVTFPKMEVGHPLLKRARREGVVHYLNRATF